MTAASRMVEVEPLLRRALAEDLDSAGDITSNAVIPPETRAHAVMRPRQPGTLCGVDVAAQTFGLTDPAASIVIHVFDGVNVSPGQDILSVDGNARAILAAERTALNCVGHLSGIASETRRMIELVAATGARICCTRKTTPGLRRLEKYAVHVGGGDNHRSGLYDAMLIKDNHIAAAGGIRPAVTSALMARTAGTRLEVEVDSVAQLEEILDLPIDAVLLDNMPPAVLHRCVALVAGRFVTKASGGITAANIRAVAETGVDVISLGWLTHSAPALDVGLDFDVGTWR